MEKSTLYGIGIFIILIVGGLFFMKGNSADINGGTINDIENKEAQKITLSVQDYNYYPNTITVKVNQPVEITLDESVSGCLRDFTISAFGVRKYSSSPEEKIIFTPTKKGTFRFACSMGMGTGTIIVE
jgi:plastocyanin domain-containing protein